MRRTLWAKAILVGLVGGTLLVTPSCGDIAVASVKNGLYSFVTGSLYSTLGSQDFSTILNNLTTGGGSTTDTNF